SESSRRSQSFPPLPAFPLILQVVSSVAPEQWCPAVRRSGRATSSSPRGTNLQQLQSSAGHTVPMIAGTRLEPMLRARPLYSHALVSPRRPLLAALLAAALLLAGCRQGDVGPRMSKSLDEAREWRTQLVETSRRIHPDSAEPVLLISLGYLERARLGMGSPFRLAHSASIDTRLPEPVRRQAAWAILAMTVDGQVYHPQWGALDSL